MGATTQWGGCMAGLGRWATLMCTSEKKNLSCSYHGRMSGPAQACARACGLAGLGLAWHAADNAQHSFRRSAGPRGNTLLSDGARARTHVRAHTRDRAHLGWRGST